MKDALGVVGSHRTCRFLTDVSLGCRDNQKLQINWCSPRTIRVDCDKILRIERRHEREKTYVAVHNYGKNLRLRRVRVRELVARVDPEDYGYSSDFGAGSAFDTAAMPSVLLFGREEHVRRALRTPAADAGAQAIHLRR
ncbi:Uncharacterised protein [Mycobacteroides abscessus subsp. abscessus]|uniref:hypothetical protein n=1 Tax=Mycobacteroides abscessus TaxID=36809 RepID=UPI00092C39DB|nr:hypothetical protein [Mycobacteroides abscessus]SIH19490.1 Uncharacterised protein [Mycobacteroides abscessus subsp. abscessus]